MATRPPPIYNGSVPTPRTGALGAMTLLYTDPLFLRHDTGQHPERADRLRSVTARLGGAGLIERCTRGACSPLTEDAVKRVPPPSTWPSPRPEPVSPRSMRS